ncbi:MAG: hypothetical protein ACFCU5_15270 [Pleurocapsa sp.]
MLRKILVILMSLSLCWTTVGCSGASTSTQSVPTFNNNANVAPTSISLADGKYPVQQATYDDASGEYSLMLLNTPAGSPPILRTTQLQMARLSDDAIASGEKTYVEVENNQPVMYLTEDFRIEYVHNVTETQSDPQTGQPQTVVVRRESNFWTPFAGALAGQAIGSLLFRPQYYVPPVYQPGGVLTGYGGYGNSYSQAVNRYQERYNAPPAAVTNRRTLRTTGNLRNTVNRTTNKFSQPTNNKSRATGSGVGSSTLRSSGKTRQFQRSPGFGSSRPTMRNRGFGGRRR